MARGKKRKYEARLAKRVAAFASNLKPTSGDHKPGSQKK